MKEYKISDNFGLDEYMKKELLVKYTNWLDSLNDEIGYWQGYLTSSGGDYPDDFKFRLRQDTFIKERDKALHQKLLDLPLNNISLLDVGSGPLTNLGKNVDGKNIQITACDPLADAYNIIIDNIKISPPVRTMFADCENLSHFFPTAKFDAVHCANALDHSYDPVSGICEMLAVVKDEGFIHLGHFENEAEAESYSGLHQWNFTERNGVPVIWNKSLEVNLSDFFGEAVEINALRMPQSPKDWIVIDIRKNKSCESFLEKRRSTLAIKYQLSIKKHCRNFFESSVKTSTVPKGGIMRKIKKLLGA